MKEPEMTDPETTGESPDWTALREHRSPWWRPGMNTQLEPWAALAETNVGHIVQLFGRDENRARERMARWRLVADLNDGWADGRYLVAAVLVDPRGEVVEGWKRSGDTLPHPLAPPRWSPLRQLSEWTTCISCKARRWPGCWIEVGGAGCALCLPARETDDPRVWPREPEQVVPDPTAAKKKTIA
jgi:hypothetical protein